uniref:Uncharacterized protein n=1 Tax=Timema cristinae TaxID=61476 RepID=A0A7R9H0B6_TIMCR|nr:unnamed protein product [Timema cristinae]
MQAARLLLPGVDCPIRQIVGGPDEPVVSKRSGDEVEYVRRLKTELAFKMLRSGRTDLIQHALQLLPPNKKLNSVNEHGLTPLMVAVLLHEEGSARCLLDAGADPDVETPPSGAQGCPYVHAEAQHWTSLTYAILQGSCSMVRLLLERGAHVEGGTRLSEDKCTLTPLQVAVACGNTEMVSLLLAHGAHPFLSTLLKDSLCYSGAAQRGCYRTKLHADWSGGQSNRGEANPFKMLSVQNERSLSMALDDDRHILAGFVVARLGGKRGDGHKDDTTLIHVQNLNSGGILKKMDVFDLHEITKTLR